MIPDLTGMPGLGDTPAFRKCRQRLARRAFDVYLRRGRQPTACFQGCRDRSQQTRRKRGIQKYHIENFWFAGQKAQGVRDMDLRRRGPLAAPQRQGLLKFARRFCGVFHEHSASSAARQRLESQRAAAGEEIEAVRVGDRGTEPVEKGLAHSVRSRPYRAFGKAPGATAPGAADDPQRARLALIGLSSHGSSYNSDMPSFFERLRQKLNSGNSWLTMDLATLFRGRKIDAAILEELETRLLTADVGVEATEYILEELRKRVARQELGDVAALIAALRQSVAEILRPCAQPLQIDSRHRPFVILVVGVNGSGKTTSIGKLAQRLSESGQSVMLAAGDTFRAA